MKRTALALPRAQSSPRPARKSEWLRSALAHHHRPDPGAENEIVVLATGVDQYLQEVFHHLAYRHQQDAVLAEDFAALCAVLGLPGAQIGPGPEQREGEGEEEQEEEFRQDGGKEEEFRDLSSGLPQQLSFKDFHSRLCGYFRVRCSSGGTEGRAWRMPVSTDTELVERQIRVRWPRVRRRKCVSFDLTTDPSGTTKRCASGRSTEDVREPDEAAALRELVEDLRSALQGSDARCLALEVALRREKCGTVPVPCCCRSPGPAPPPSITLAQGKLVPTHRLKGQASGRGDGASRVQRRRDIRDPLLRELKLIRSSRDGQLEEARKYSERCEEELHWAYGEMRRLQGVESSLRKDNSRIRRRAEEAREALSLGLQTVRLIQEQARSVPHLKSRVDKLEAELLQYRSRCSCLSPAHPADPCSNTAGLQRAVEGRAASDEEEEDGGRKEGGRRCPLEVKKHVCHLHGCGKGGQVEAVAGHEENRAGTVRAGLGCCSQERPAGSRSRDEETTVSRGVLGRTVKDRLEACS